jgi:hypothetical protein
MFPKLEFTAFDVYQKRILTSLAVLNNVGTSKVCIV